MPPRLPENSSSLLGDLGELWGTPRIGDRLAELFDAVGAPGDAS